MASYEHKDNTGTMRKNDRKAEGSSQPDYKGSGKIDGVNKDFSAWLKKDKNGVTFMSFSFQQPYAKKAAGDDDTTPRASQRNANTPPAYDDDLAF